MSKKRIFSGVKPSGELHLGNYLGAISQWVKMQNDYECIFCVVDHHAITVPQEPDVLRKRILEIAKIYIASGIDPKKSVIFQQSDVKEHTELAWILNTISRMSDLFRMTQFKDKANVVDITSANVRRIEIPKEFKNVEEYYDFLIKENGEKAGSILFFNKALENTLTPINKAGVGLFDYPVLMASDIVLYNTDVVPVGEDQVQHLELTRTLARRFNKRFKKDILKVPETKVLKEGARIMALDNPEKKMSKSASSEYNYIALMDEPKKARKKIMKAVTDTDGVVKYDTEKKAGISNLLTIYSILANKEIKTLEKEYVGKGYGDFKKDLVDIVEKFLINFQEKYNSLSDKDVRDILDKGSKKVRPIAEDTVLKVKKAVGLK